MPTDDETISIFPLAFTFISFLSRVMNYYLLFMLGVLIFEVSICTGLKYFYNSRGYVPFSWYFYEVAKPDYEISVRMIRM